MIIKKVNYTNHINELKSFLSFAGSSLNTFRYFNKRELSTINNHLLTVLCYNNSEPIGYGHIDCEKDKYWLGICVTESHLGKGIGKKIIIYLIEESLNLNVDEVYLSVDEENIEAINLYEKFGFIFQYKYNKTKFYKLTLDKPE